MPEDTNSFPLKAAIFDWAGTTIDYGSRAPVSVFRAIFRESGMEISEQEARAPMGLAKREHIRAVLENPEVTKRWETAMGSAPTSEDVDKLYERFLPLQRELLAQHVDVIPGVVETIAFCRERGMKIGSTTGYTRALMDVVAPLAAKQGYLPDSILCSDDVSAGRPAPWMIYRTAECLNVYSMKSIVKVDDTPIGIHAARNAGTWVVAVAVSGNQMGLSPEEVQALSTTELDERRRQITEEFKAAGAHEVIDSVADLPPVLLQFANRLENGEQP